MVIKSWWIQKTKKVTYWKLWLFLRKFSVIVAHYCNKVGITPNQVVLWRVFLFWGASIYLFYSDLYLYNIAGIWTIFLCYFFDLVDGDLARNYNMKSDLWKFLDEELDSVVVTWLVLTFACKFYFWWYESIYVVWWILALFGIIWSTKMTNMYQARFWINCVSWHNDIEEALKKEDRDTMSEFIYQLITPKNFFLSLFSNFRYYLLFGVISGYIHIAVLLFAIAITIRWITLFITITQYYAFRDTKKTHVALFKIMNTLERNQ